MWVPSIWTFRMDGNWIPWLSTTLTFFMKRILSLKEGSSGSETLCWSQYLLHNCLLLNVSLYIIQGSIMNGLTCGKYWLIGLQNPLGFWQRISSQAATRYIFYLPSIICLQYGLSWWKYYESCSVFNFWLIWKSSSTLSMMKSARCCNNNTFMVLLHLTWLMKHAGPRVSQGCSYYRLWGPPPPPPPHIFGPPNPPQKNAKFDSSQ